MRIDAVACSGFGPLEDFVSVGWADTGVVVVLGDNESGKSSLVDVVESCLFGFEARKRVGRPRTLSISLEVQERRLHVERTLGGTGHRARIGGGVAWRDLGREPLDVVGAIDRSTWRQLHRITVDGAADAASWRQAEVLLGGVRRQTSSPGVIAARLEKQARSLWRPDRRGRPEARRLREELERLESARDADRRTRRAAEAERAARLERRRRAKATLRRVRRMLQDDMAELGRDVDAAKQEQQRAEAQLATLSRDLFEDCGDHVAAKVLAVEAWPESPAAVPAWIALAACLPAFLGGSGIIVAGLCLAGVIAATAHQSARTAARVDAALDAAGLARRADVGTMMNGWLPLVQAAEVAEASRSERRRVVARRRARVGRLREVVEDARAALAASREIDGQDETSVRDFDGEIAALEDELARVRRRHDRLLLGAAVLREVEERIRRDVRPRLVAEASRLLGDITDGERTLELEEVDGEAVLHVVGADGSRCLLDSASRGAREQVLLSIRLALIERAESRGAATAVALPLILDDAFATWDPRRRAAGARVMARIARTRQVIALTPDPTVARAFRDACGARIVELARTTRAASADATTAT